MQLNAALVLYSLNILKNSAQVLNIDLKFFFYRMQLEILKKQEMNRTWMLMIDDFGL